MRRQDVRVLGSTRTQSTVRLSTADVALEDVRRVACERARVEVEPDAVELVSESRAIVERALDAEEPVYGLNTGLGHTRDQRVSREILLAYQEQIVREHAGAVGPPLPDGDVRAIVFTRAVGIARGGSGARPEVLQGLVDLLNAGVHPLVAEVGSVGAADLGHLGQIAWALTGHGEARLNGELLPASDALARAGLEPLRLQPKDGIALLVANSVSIGLGALAVLEGERAARLADLAGALTLETLGGNLSILEPEVQAAKPLQGQADAAASLRALLAGSRLWRAGAAASLQDPLSIRTLPQVHGAFREQLAGARHAVSIELNGRGDNPLLVPETGRALSNGNFHALALALAFDALRVGIAHVGMVSERRIAKLTALRWGHDVSVDDLVRNGHRQAERYAAPGLLAYSGAAISGELKQLAAPVTLGAPPLDLDVEDHATFAPQAVELTRRAVARLVLLLTIEAFLAADALGARAEPPRLGEGTGRAYAELAALVGGFGPEISAATAVARAQELLLALVRTS